MPPVEGLRIDAVELMHGFGQIGVGGFEEQVEVIGHQAVGTDKIKIQDLTLDFLREGVNPDH
jgi:hypothetical protein